MLHITHAVSALVKAGDLHKDPQDALIVRLTLCFQGDVRPGSCLQVMACAGFYLLETLALRADSDPAPEMLAGLDIPAPQDFSNLPNSDPE